MNSKNARDHIERKAQTSAGQYNVNLNTLGSLLIPLPPLEEQEVIINELERIFSLIENCERIINKNLLLTQSLSQSILKVSFEGKLISQNPNDEPVSILLERIKQEKLKDIKNNIKRRR